MKTLFVTLFITLVMVVPLMAIESPEGVTIPYADKDIAYNGDQFYEVLEAYGLTLTVETAKNLPPCYGKLKENTTEFSRNATSLQVFTKRISLHFNCLWFNANTR